MIRFTILGVRVCLHPLSVLMVLLALSLGIRGEMLAVLLALTVHEAAHMAAAMLAGVRIPELQLLPFGGAAHIENPYALRAGQLLFTALAGPAANLILMVIAAAMGWSGALSAAVANKIIGANAMLMGFNLIPALPLDGGRALYALASERMGRHNALGLGIALGRVLAALLLLAALAGFFAARQLNLTLVLASVFLFSAAPSERRALSEGSAYAMLNGLRPYGKPCCAKVYAVDAGEEISSALRVCRPSQPSLFCVYQGGKMTGVLDERTLVEALSDGSRTVGSAGEREKTGSAKGIFSVDD